MGDVNDDASTHLGADEVVAYQGKLLVQIRTSSNAAPMPSILRRGAASAWRLRRSTASTADNIISLTWCCVPSEVKVFARTCCQAPGKAPSLSASFTLSDDTRA